MEEAVPSIGEWPADSSLYELSTKIGQGAFATVWKAVRKDESLECAVKVLDLDSVDANLAEIRQEVQSMRLLLNPNVLPCHTAFVNKRNLWLITPMMRKGSSLHSLQAARRERKRQSGDFKPSSMERHIMYIMHETLLGLKYIHENGQIHRDIKAGNILVDTDGQVKIADFGVSGFLVQAGAHQAKAKTFVGTPCWMSPEVMEQVHGYDYKADVWSLGITALELAKGYAPYAKYPPMRVLILTIQEDPPSLASYDEETNDYYEDEVHEEFSAQFEAFVAQCLEKNPSKRPTCPDLLESKHFASFTPDHRRERQKQLADEVCNIIPDVGDKAHKGHRVFPGNAPVSIVLDTSENRQKGTTWVFQDGSQVLSSSMKPVEVEDVMDQLDEFAEQTGGENYRQENQRQRDTEADELDDFFDDFEQNHAAGENFRRS